MKTTVSHRFMVEVTNVQSFYLDSLARENIKYFMEKSKISQRKMAKIADGAISYGFIKMLLSGQTSTISKDKLMVVCEVLQIQVDEIFTNSAKFTVSSS